MPEPMPPGAASAQTAVTVLLTNDQTAFLDEVAAEIRRESGGCISRSAMLRAILSALKPYAEDWLKCRTETEVKEVIAFRLRVGSQAQQQPKAAQPQTR
jgi:hypothetical protein